MVTAELDDRHWIFVEDSPFLPPRGGGELEHFGMLRDAARLGLVALIVLPSPAGAPDLARYAEQFPGIPVLPTPRRTSPLLVLHPRDPFVVASRPAPRWLVSRARALAPDANGVVITSYKSWRIGHALASALRLPAVLRMHNREGAYHHSLASGTRGPRSLALRLDAVRIDRDERRLGRAAWLGGIADISDDDARWRREAGAHDVAAVPPFAVDLTQPAPSRAPDPSSPHVLFLGALDVATNTVALRWLLSQVWPGVRARVPEAVLDVVGRRPTQAIVDLIAAAPGATLHADVPEVEPFLQRTSVAVNPAITGSGVNIKLIEYLHAGLPLVSTSLATRGLALRAGVDLHVRDDAPGFGSAIVELLGSPGDAATMGEAGQARLRELIDPVANLTVLARLMGQSRQSPPVRQ